MSLARGLLLATIRGYQRHVSPRKGFGCPCRVHLGVRSCSALGLRAISRYGAWHGLGVLRLRLAECRLVAKENALQRVAVRRSQAGFVDCDVPCDASCTDLPSCSCGDWLSADSACEVASCIGCDTDACDWFWPGRPAESPGRRRRRRGDPAAWEPGPGTPLDPR